MLLLEANPRKRKKKTASEITSPYSILNVRKAGNRIFQRIALVGSDVRTLSSYLSYQLSG
jgi:hypothetical protein